MIRVAMGIDDGTVCGKATACQYWGAALLRVPDLHFELVEHTQGMGPIAIYRSVMGKMTIEVMFFDEDGKVKKAIAYYS